MIRLFQEFADGDKRRPQDMTASDASSTECFLVHDLGAVMVASNAFRREYRGRGCRWTFVNLPAHMAA